ncbi:protein kinase [Streptomyces lavendulae]|uniref:protein kinase domain-containing protein n=1 Tax=Streptomyces lavendulae TaxID=1914 RepID=UPI00371BDD47
MPSAVVCEGETFTIAPNRTVIVTNKSLGQGSFGIICEGLMDGGKGVAVKKFTDLKNGQSQAAREISGMEKLGDPNSADYSPYVVKMYGRTGGSDTPLRIVYELAGVDSLDNRIEKATFAEKIGWVRDILDGLRWVHGKGVAHGDISDQNILIAPVGGSSQAKIIDLGEWGEISDQEKRETDYIRIRKLLGIYMFDDLPDEVDDAAAYLKEKARIEGFNLTDEQATGMAEVFDSLINDPPPGASEVAKFDEEKLNAFKKAADVVLKAGDSLRTPVFM